MKLLGQVSASLSLLLLASSLLGAVPLRVRALADVDGSWTGSSDGDQEQLSATSCGTASAPATKGTVCRAATTACDVAETCAVHAMTFVSLRAHSSYRSARGWVERADVQGWL